MRKLVLLGFTFLLLLGLVTLTHGAPIVPAPTKPALSLSRVTASVQADWAWYTSEGATPSPAPRGELYPRLTLGYSFKALTLGASGGYGCVTGLPEATIGGRVTPFTRGSTSDPVAAVGLDYVFYGKSPRIAALVPKGELRGSLNVAIPLKDALSLPLFIPASVQIPLTSRVLGARVGIGVLLGRYPR